MRHSFEASSIIQRIDTYPMKKWLITAQTYVYLLTFQPKSVILYLINLNTGKVHENVHGRLDAAETMPGVANRRRRTHSTPGV